MQLLSLLLCLIGMPFMATAELIEISSVREFYDTVNSDSKYSLVKYYTNWCSHCKSIAPIVEEVSSSSLFHKPSSNVQFLAVNCDKFSGSLCSHLLGYPTLELVSPLQNNTLNQEESKEEEVSPLNLLSVWHWVRSYLPLFETYEELDESRVSTYKLERSVKAISDYIEKMIQKDKLSHLAEFVFNDEPCDDPLVSAGREYVDYLRSLGSAYDYNTEHDRIRFPQGKLKGHAGVNDELSRFKIIILSKFSPWKNDCSLTPTIGTETKEAEHPVTKPLYESVSSGQHDEL